MAAVHGPHSISIGPSCANGLLAGAITEAVAEPTPRLRVVTAITPPPEVEVAVAIAIRPRRAVAAVVVATLPVAAAIAAEDDKLT